MINFVYRGLGSKYTQYIRDGIKRIDRRRTAYLLTEYSGAGYAVAIHHSGEALTVEQLRELLVKPKLTFHVGDSRGMPEEILNASNAVYSVSGLPIHHQMEMAILVEEVEKALAEREKELRTK